MLVWPARPWGRDNQGGLHHGEGTIKGACAMGKGNQGGVCHGEGQSRGRVPRGGTIKGACAMGKGNQGDVYHGGDNQGGVRLVLPPSIVHSAGLPNVPADKFQSSEASSTSLDPIHTPQYNSMDSLTDSRLNLQASDWDLFDASTSATATSREDEVSWI